jgi:tagatose 1,6-diphosphate aldolase
MSIENQQNRAFVERVGTECHANNMPFFLEVMTYVDAELPKIEAAKLKPELVCAAVEEFSKPRYYADVLKVINCH